MAETQIAVTEKSVAQYVQDTCPALIKSYAVRDYNAASWMKTAMLCIVENKDLMDCLSTETGRISLKHALRFAATTGLSLNPQEGKAALVPINGKVNYWPMKNGLVDLILATGAVARVRMNAVRQNDHFRISESMDGDSYEFSPNVKQRGEIIGFFCAIKLTSGESIVEYMTDEEMKKQRDTYGKDKRPDSAWNKSYEGMGIAKVTKRAIKRLALPPESEKVVNAALADGDAIEASFVETPATEEKPPKGTSASDVERELAAKAEKAEKTGEAAQAEKTAEAQPAGEQPAPAAQASQPVHPVAPGSTPAAGSKDPSNELDIF